MKIKEITERIQSLYSRGVASDDSRLSNRLIYNNFLSVRANLLSQQAKKKQRVSQWNYQTLPCVELEKVPLHECPCAPATGCEILRSKYTIPSPLNGFDGPLILAVNTIDRSKKIDPITLNALKSLRGNKYATKNLNFFFLNGYLYISSPIDTPNLKVVTLTALFGDPVEAKKFESLCTECKECINCLDIPELEFPIDAEQIDAMVNITLQQLLSIFLQTRMDDTNNSKDDLADIPQRLRDREDGA